MIPSRRERTASISYKAEATTTGKCARIGVARIRGSGGESKRPAQQEAMRRSSGRAMRGRRREPLREGRTRLLCGALLLLGVLQPASQVLSNKRGRITLSCALVCAPARTQAACAWGTQRATAGARGRTSTASCSRFSFSADSCGGCVAAGTGFGGRMSSSACSRAHRSLRKSTWRRRGVRG
eukprot:scaffold83988_cov28-Tisochrysis_lutea.AAC.7